MVLATDLCDASGATLLTAGSKLSETLLASLSRRGVRQVAIQGLEALSEEEREALAAAVRTRLDHLFRGADASAADRVLYRAILEFRLEQLR